MSLEGAVQDLKSRDIECRRQALDFLGGPLIKGTEETITAVGMLFEGDLQLQERAIEVLKGWGDSCAIIEVTARLEHKSHYVRQSALAALTIVAERGNEELVSAVLQRFEHSNASVRAIAVEALLKVARKSDDRLHSAVLPLLDDSDTDVQLAAAKYVLIDNVPNKDNSAIIAATMQFCNPALLAMSRAVLKCLQDDPSAIAIAAALLSHRDDKIKSSALHAVCFLAKAPNDRALLAMSALIGTGQTWISRTASASVIEHLASSHQGLDIAGEGRKGAVHAAVLCFQPDKGMQRSSPWCWSSTALHMLTQMKGHDETMAIVGEWLEHPQDLVRLSALKAFAIVVNLGHEPAVDAVKKMIVDRYAPVRKTAVEVLYTLAGPGSETAVAAIAELLKADPHCDVRLAAARVISAEERTGGRRDSSTILAALTCMANKQRAGDSLTDWAQQICFNMHKGDRSAMESLGLSLQCLLPEVRQEALKWLTRVVDKDDQNAIHMTSALLKHPDAGVRSTAVNALSKIANRGNCFSISLISSSLKHDAGYARCAAIEALREVAERGDDQTISCLIPLLEDPDGDVRRAAAITIMAQLQEPGDERAIMAACACLADSDADIRNAAVDSLGELANRGDEYAIAAISKHLHHADPCVRSAALKSLGKVAVKSDRAAMDSVSMLLNDASSDVRCDALDTLAKLSHMGNEDVASRIKACLQDFDGTVRWVAIEALLKVLEVADAHMLALGACVACFRGWKLDNSGKISRVELRAVISKLVPHMSDDQARRLFEVTDARRDEELCYDEILSWILLDTRLR